MSMVTVAFWSPSFVTVTAYPLAGARTTPGRLTEAVSLAVYTVPEVAERFPMAAPAMVTLIGSLDVIAPVRFNRSGPVAAIRYVPEAPGSRHPEKLTVAADDALSAGGLEKTHAWALLGGCAVVREVTGGP